MAELLTQAPGGVPVPITETDSVAVMHGELSKNEGAISVVPEAVAKDMMRRGGVSILPWKMDWELPPLSLIRRKREIRLAAGEKFGRILSDLCSLQFVQPEAPGA